MKRRGVTIILIITFCAVFFYGYRYIRIPVETKTAVITQIEDVISAKAYVARQEVVYHADNTGTMYSYVTDGARVAKNMRISTVYRGNVNDNLVQELNNIDIKIAELEKEKAESELFTTDNSSVESTIETIKSKIIESAVENDVSKMADYKNSINSLYNTGNDTKADTISELSQRKKSIEAQLGNDKTDIYSTMSGVFSRNVDGYEIILTPETITNYTVADFNSLPEYNTNNTVTKTVNSGDSICKVVDNHVWYAVTVIPKARAEEIRKNKNLLVRFESLPGSEVAASVIYVSDEGEEAENAVVVLKSERYLEGVYGIRSGEMDIVVSRYTGFEVPVYSIRNINGEKGVLISTGMAEMFCKCDVVYNDEEKGTAIVYPAKDAKRELAIGDKIIIGEKKDD